MTPCLAISLLWTAGSIAVPESARSHPFLFITQADIARVRAAVAENPQFRQLAQALIERAASVRLDNLPPLERDWWEVDQHKPWAETYPQIFHHTWGVPMKWARPAAECARAALLSDSEALRHKAKRLLLALSDYTFEFDHYDVGMNYTIWAVQVLDAYDILYADFTPAERERMDKFFDRCREAVIRSDEYWIAHEPGGPMNNHYAWHKVCRCMLGLFYGRDEWVEEALHGPKGVDEMFRHGFRDNGLWLEGSIPYQFAATSAFLLMAEMLENARYPTSLWRYTIADGRSLKQSYDALFPLLFPDRTLPPLGDSYARRPHLGRQPDFETLLRRFGEPAYAWLLRDAGERREQALFAGLVDLPPAEPPPQVSTHWPEHGYAALRSVEGPDYWSGEGWTLFATYSNSPVHTNEDKLSIMLFADGHLWLPDLEARTSAEHAFSARVQNELNRHTLCHNTMLVDGQTQRHPDRRLDLVEYYALPETKRISMGDLDGRLYPGVRQLRTCLVRKEYVLDMFQVQADATREFAWLLHVDGQPQDNPVRSWEPEALPQQGAWRYLRDAQHAPLNEPYRETFHHEGRAFRVDAVTDGPVSLLRCGFPRDDSAQPDTVPMRAIRSRRPATWIVAVYRVGSAVDLPLVLTVTQGPLHSWEVGVALGDERYSHRIPQLSGLR